MYLNSKLISRLPNYLSNRARVYDFNLDVTTNSVILCVLFNCLNFGHKLFASFHGKYGKASLAIIFQKINGLASFRQSS